ncbi:MULTISPECIES: hypothetical protein [Chromohalobacter]|uniref:Uncharacterized protein n=1 Tax=Chromohalobacter israelensis (strain ATCC BAA-138 / DSM 3043 / CIP 106854 / NCIMB 13768 / 1H11) TaxID=290398 RepID=Q1QTD5_CHRI1|nr:MULTISPECIES: hypothetical protein [Chromohalobacter]ABE60273.1 hypothetical protein Csal_2928 [Chromohalobacter salexigens DSM 3043]MDO0946135.1 hypothetical protein [Chromohalobacter salexigens]NQY45238.1 hypothetical protein [Chromohalobacter sp.]PWW35400.1 hypothetical protein DFO74_11651 [Chromohalobacter salexigens]
MSRRLGFALLGALVLAAVIVPYTLLSHVQAWYGSLLFWLLVGVAVVLLNLLVTAAFKEK